MYKRHTLEVVRLYKLGYGRTTISKELKITESIIGRWLIKNNQLGNVSFQKQSYTKSTSEFKASVVREVLEKYLSYEQVAINNGVSLSAVYSWVQQVKLSGYESLLHTKPRG